MGDGEQQKLGALTKVVISVALIMLVSGMVWYGVTFATIDRVLNQIAARPGGPMSFRFILQPMMAAIAALHDARRDARLGRAPYLFTILRRPEERIARLREAANATARIVLLGLVMDAIYQVIVLQRFHPVEAVIVALMLALVPYVALRGVVLRVVRRWHGTGSAREV